MAGKLVENNRSEENDCLWQELDASTICITGSTGLVCSNFVRSILELVNKNKLSCNLVLPVRDINKAKAMFGSCSCVSYYRWRLGDQMPAFSESIDYFIHGACRTSSQDFINYPVETIDEIYKGTVAVLEFCKKRSIKKSILLSTMEVYGEIDGSVNETDFGALDSMVVRNCYPEAKRLSETLFASYFSEYGVPACVLRLAQTFGAGVNLNDGRVFAEFAKRAISNQDIVLFSDGSMRNTYVSLRDVVNAILYVLVYGECGQAYNVSNEFTYCSIYEMAKMVLDNFGNSSARIIFGEDASRKKSFRKSSDLFLSSKKLEGLGWHPHDNLFDMYKQMIDHWNCLDEV